MWSGFLHFAFNQRIVNMNNWKNWHVFQNIYIIAASRYCSIIVKLWVQVKSRRLLGLKKLLVIPNSQGLVDTTTTHSGNFSGSNNTVIVKLWVQTMSRSTPEDFKVYWDSKTFSSLRSGPGDWLYNHYIPPPTTHPPPTRKLFWTE